MEKATVTGHMIRLESMSIDMGLIAGIVGTDAGTALVLRDGSSVLVDLDAADIFTVRDRCPWATCAI